MYILTHPARARIAFDTVTQIIANHTGVRAHLGKCRCWNARGGEAPPGIAGLGPDVWRGDKTQRSAHSRLAREESFLQWLPKMRDLQCAWLLLRLCAAPRANHLLRSIPPTLVRPYAEAHDE